ncbi:hypothetical protein PAECIP111891_04258 [Paenibacillus allorhizoplanae]|uniref:Uncharacterized protein n=1 Tax=Paenibacillus allorhizoplanae TaxID=2905648 RepID=A0ABN8GUU5_9BACL|nr:hypothetical protein PAECIP111891_04258 [Paenibacillus allorhizoplanae]
MVKSKILLDLSNESLIFRSGMGISLDLSSGRGEEWLEDDQVEKMES